MLAAGNEKAERSSRSNSVLNLCTNMNFVVTSKGFLASFKGPNTVRTADKVEESLVAIWRA